MKNCRKHSMELDRLTGLFFNEDCYEADVKNHRSEEDDFRANVKIKSKDGSEILIKLAENDFTAPERIFVWKQCAQKYRRLGYYCPDFYADKSGGFPTVEFKGHRCVAWAEEYSKYHTAEELGISRGVWWDDAVIMTAKAASQKYDFADFPSAYCLFDLFCPSDKTDEVMSNALLWKAYADTLPSQLQSQIQRIWKGWVDNRAKLEKIYPLLPTSVFQADLNPSNILLSDSGKFVGVLDFNLCGKDVFLNYLFREVHFGSFDDELDMILRSLETAKSFYSFTDLEKESAELLYRCIKPLWFTRCSELKNAKGNMKTMKKLLDETEYALTREIDFASVMD